MPINADVYLSIILMNINQFQLKWLNGLHPQTKQTGAKYGL